MLTHPRWYVAQTQTHGERKAIHHLQRQGFATYLPQYLKRRRHARRVEMVAAPLFSRYVFVAVDIAMQRWRAINSTIGVARLVCNGEDPTPVPAEEDGGFIRLDRLPRFAPGDKIRVLDGIFASCLGLFEGVTDTERVAILLDLLGRRVRVHLDTDLVVAA